ncbi:MAG: hypothetical protein PHX70_02295 [Clostridium sp.]|nr:hypothetical protein [Clostridium sp.]
MDYRIDKVDLEVRERINAKTASEKVHRKSKVQAVNGRNDYENEENSEKKFVLPDNKKNGKKFLVKAVNEDKTSIDVEAFKDEKPKKTIRYG